MSQTLKFRLQEGHIFEFKYSKYSEFIDNLEPEPGVIIDVLEPFTIEQFETAQIEYNKYLVYKEALEDIITVKKLWSKEKLKEFSKYDLDNPVLEWLMIRDNREDKEIKDKLSLVPFRLKFRLKNIDNDNIILYYIVSKTSQVKFLHACLNGHLEVAQWLYNLEDVDIHFKDEYAFSLACQNGHLEVAQWLYSKGIDIHYSGNGGIQRTFELTCDNGHLGVVRWLHSLRCVDIHLYDEMAFRYACRNGHLELAQWLYKYGGVDIHIQNDDAFRLASLNGHLELSQWLYSLGHVVIQIDEDYDTFRLVCSSGHLEMAQWLYSLGGVNIHFRNNWAFKLACQFGHLEVVKWLWSLGGFNKKGIITDYQYIKDWLATLG